MFVYMVWLNSYLWCPSSKKTEAKPAHSSNNNRGGRRNTEDTDDNKGSVGHLDYNPTSGVTFRENKTADVQVVGKGYTDETAEAKVVPPVASTSRIKEKRKLMINRGQSLLSLLSVLFFCSLHWLTAQLHKFWLSLLFERLVCSNNLIVLLTTSPTHFQLKH